MTTNYDIQTTFDSNDMYSAALCAWKEARGEGSDGMLAVLCVLKNRVGVPGFARNLHDIIYGKNQFTSMSVPTDPEFNLQPEVDDESFTNASTLSNRVFSGDLETAVKDITNGAHYYANLHVIGTDNWFYRNIVLNSISHPITAQIGKHTFFA